MKLVAVDPWAGAGAGFNRTAADAVYKAMTAMDEDSALVYGRILVADSVRYDLVAHREELAKVASEVVSKRAATLRQHYTRTAVAKARSGEDNTHELTCLVQIGKAWSLTTQERSQNAQKQTRGAGGRFVQEHTRISTNEARSPMDQKEAARVGDIPEAKLEGKDLAAYQQAVGQIQDMLMPFHNQDLGAMLHLRISERGGDVRSEQFMVGTKAAPSEIKDKLGPGDRIETAAVSVTPPPNVQGATVDAMAAAGMPRLGGYAADAYNGGVLSVPRMREFNQSRLTVGDNEPFSGASRAFGRLERGSAILQDSLGPVAPPKLQYALAVANHVGQYGPEAQKVIGPAADRAAYRYRGTERSMDPKLQFAFRDLARQGYKGADLREVAVGGIAEGRDGWNPGAVLNYFRGQLSDPDLNELQRRSGVIPPSEGIIVASNGSVAHQSVGFADDWYLPFNLRHLTALKGGEYIRTRTFGGPTTEDIYTGLVSGSKALTVVSHNGVFTIDFDRNLRGGRRFNDKAARMVARYGQLLDAVRSEQVSRGGISPSRMSELRDSARDFEPNEASTAHQERLSILLNDERRTPTLSRQESSDAAAEWLGGMAARQTTSDGRTMAPDELVNQLVDTEAKTRLRTSKETAARVGSAEVVGTMDQYQGQVRGELGGDSPTARVRAVAAMMGQTSQFDRAMQRATEDNARRVQSLKLDGAGYATALKALQEQFPYYIRASYTPWRDSQGRGADRTREGMRDTGYVAPKFNRPEEAEAGFFNPDVTGRGKVNASSVRYQNYRVGQGKLVPAGSRRGVGRNTPATGGAAATTPAKTAVSDVELQRAANMALLDDILSNEKFPAGAKIAGDDVGGFDIRTEINHPRFPNEALKRVFAPNAKAQIEAMAPDAFSELMEQVLKVTEGPDKVLTVSPEKVRAVRSKGKAVPPAAVPASVPSMLDEIVLDHTFPGIAYDPLRTASVDQIERTYGSDRTIGRLLAESKELLPVSDEAFETKILPLQARLKAAATERTRQASLGQRPDREQEYQDQQDTEGLLRATQLRRRWVEAKKSETPPAAAEPTSTTTNQVILSPDLLTTLQEQINAASNPDARHVIT